MTKTEKDIIKFDLFRAEINHLMATSYDKILFDDFVNQANAIIDKHYAFAKNELKWSLSDYVQRLYMTYNAYCCLMPVLKKYKESVSNQ